MDIQNNANNNNNVENNEKWCCPHCKKYIQRIINTNYV